MRNLTMAVLAVGLAGCGKQASPPPAAFERTALLYGLSEREKQRVDLALDRHAAGELTDKDLIEIAGQLHKQALSRLAAEDALEQMSAERARAMQARREREVRIAAQLKGDPEGAGPKD